MLDFAVFPQRREGAYSSRTRETRQPPYLKEFTELLHL